ncbi:MAG: flippase-like domain-containing protein, partial [Desulfobulbaceae bacterium]|nr:flippase-like domain-containing protein [Desulfobulbaceae bacterium]
MKSSTTRYIIKLGVSFSIIGFIISKVDWHTMGKIIQRADSQLLATAFFLLFIERLWAVVKWRALLVAMNNQVSFFRLFCIYTIGTFWGLFLPSSLSTDVIRGYYLSKKTSNSAMSAASVVMDRMMGLFSLLFLCLVSLAFYSVSFDRSITVYILGFTACSIVAGILMHQETIPDILEQRISFFSKNPLGVKLIAMHRAFLKFKQYPLIMMGSFINSLILQIIRVVTIYVTAKAFNIDAHLISFFLVVPVTIIVIMVPISIGGLGVREGSFTALFSLVNIPFNEAVAISATNSIMV